MVITHSTWGLEAILQRASNMLRMNSLIWGLPDFNITFDPNLAWWKAKMRPKIYAYKVPKYRPTTHQSGISLQSYILATSITGFLLATAR